MAVAHRRHGEKAQTLHRCDCHHYCRAAQGGISSNDRQAVGWGKWSKTWVVLKWLKFNLRYWCRKKLGAVILSLGTIKLTLNHTVIILTSFECLGLFVSCTLFFFSFQCFQTIVRGSKLGADGSLTWLLDEFDTMSVTRSNSLRRGSPPTQPRKDSTSSLGGGQENGDPHHRHYSHSDR